MGAELGLCNGPWKAVLFLCHLPTPKHTGQTAQGLNWILSSSARASFGQTLRGGRHGWDGQ